MGKNQEYSQNKEGHKDIERNVRKIECSISYDREGQNTKIFCF